MTNPSFMEASCAASCYLFIASGDPESPELAVHNSWLVLTDSERTSRVVCGGALVYCRS